MHEPTKATSIGVPAMGSPGRSDMYAKASSSDARSASGAPWGKGRGSSTPTLWPGLMPQVTIGASAPASISTRSS